MSTIDYVSIVLAITAILEAYTYGSIFKNLRAFLEEPPKTFLSFLIELKKEICSILTPTTAKLVELLSCVFCLSYHIPWITLLVLKLFGHYESSWLYWPMHSLAITFGINRLMNIIVVLRGAVTNVRRTWGDF